MTVAEDRKISSTLAICFQKLARLVLLAGATGPMGAGYKPFCNSDENIL
jgi:hypothetical protein